MENRIIIHNENKEIELIDVSEIFVEVTNGELLLKLAYFEPINELKIKGNINNNGHLNVVFVDYSKKSINCVARIDLNEIEATCDWKLASLSSLNNTKKFDISFIHNKEKTIAVMNNYGVSKDKANIIFTGVNHIKEKCSKSITRQNAKIILFDEQSKGSASPILKIDENDVVASHGAIVGQISDEHMFYLMSRGLNEKEARELIIKGYLSPFTSVYSEKTQERIALAIKEAI